MESEKPELDDKDRGYDRPTGPGEPIEEITGEECDERDHHDAVSDVEQRPVVCRRRETGQENDGLAEVKRGDIEDEWHGEDEQRVDSIVIFSRTEKQDESE